MASSPLIARARSVAARPSLLLKAIAPKPMPTAPRVISHAASRVSSVLGSVESMIPLHSAIASARLRSSLAVDSTCWSWLSQGLATPL